MNRKLLWLDDCRSPFDGKWLSIYAVGYVLGSDDVTWAKDFDDFVTYFATRGMPDLICFDHDLGEGESGYDCAKWLVEYCMDQDLDVPAWKIQSSNPVGKENINALLFNYRNSRKLQSSEKWDGIIGS
jgi:hypothetical protein